ncbi:MAG: FtsX-like permease family protein [Eubacteriales bacterium]
MKKAAIKLSGRSIRSSMGRWLALLLIVMLSVGFYSGLRLCRPAFWQACQNYVDEQNLYDFRVYSTLGFDDDDVSDFSAMDGVEYAEGVKTKDLLVTSGDTNAAYVFISLPGSLYQSEDASEEVSSSSVGENTDSSAGNVNLPSLTAGRYPESADECVVDHRVFDESSIGDTITISDENDSDDLDDMARKTYKIVGLVNSPLYLDHNLGSTSIGSGSLEGYIYIPEEDFDTDYYTEIDLTLEESDSYDVYSDEYDDLIDTWEQKVEDKAGTIADEDYEAILDDIMDEANEEIDEANQQIRDQAEQEAEEQIQAVAEQAAAAGQDPEQAAAEAQQTIEEQTEESIESMLIPEMTRDEAVEEAEDNGVTEPDTYVLTRNDNAGYVNFKSDTSIINAIAGVFPIFFILIALLVCVTTMTRMVNEERTQIGTLKAMGYSDFSITMKYMIYAGSATFLGWAAGFAIGTALLPQVFWSAYSVLYGFTELPYVFDLQMAVLTLVVSLVAIFLSVWISCRSELLSVPAALIRPKAAKPGKRILIEHFQRLWKKLSFLRKATFRNMGRYKIRMVMMVVGIGCCTALIVTAFGIRDSMIDVGTMQFDSIQTYQLEASVGSGDAETAESSLEEIDEVSETLPVISSVVDVSANGEQMNSVTLNAFDEDEYGEKIGDFWTFETWDGTSSVSYPEDGEVLLSRRLAQKLGVSEGDTVTIVDDSGDEPRSIELTVSGVYRNYINNYVFITADTWEEEFSDSASDTSGDTQVSEDTYMDEVNAFLVRTDGEVDDDLLHEVNNSDGVKSVTNLADTLEQVNDSLSVLNYIIWLIIGFAGALAFIVIFNLTNINIAERSREIATVQVLGFYPRETRSYVLWENLVLSVLASVIGLPLGYLFCRFVVNQILIDGMTYPVIIHPVSYIASFVLSVIFALIVNLFMRRQIRSVNMAESLKAVE